MWMIRSGAGWCTLINSSRGFRSAPSVGEDECVRMENRKASEFVSYLMKGSEDYSPVLEPGSGGWFLSDGDL